VPLQQRRNNNKRQLVRLWSVGGGAVRSNFKRKSKAKGGGNVLIFSFDLPEHAKRDLRIKRARRKS